MSEQYMVSVAGPGLQMRRVVSAELAMEILNRVVSEPPREDPAAGATVSLSEFIEGFEYLTNVETIAVIALYLSEHLPKAHPLGKREIMNWWGRAGRTEPSNFARDFQDCLTRRFIEPVPQRSNMYRITKDGVAHLKSKLLRHDGNG